MNFSCAMFHITESTSPVKLFEYMAMGKPVVATSLPECKKYELVKIADTKEDFVEEVLKLAEKGKSEEFQSRLMECARANDWKAKAAELKDFIKVKEALSYLANATGKLTITPETINHALQSQDMVATWPADTKEGWWRYRLKGSTLLGHDPADPLKQPVEAEKIKDFYQKWYTPDAMTLLVVGNVDARSVVDQINKTFGELKGKRETPAPVPTLSPLRAEAVSIMTDAVRQDRLSIMWDTPWQPIRESAALLRYWRADLAREALFWHVQQALSASNSKDIGLGFDCRVLYLRAQCAINIESPNDKLNSNLNLVARELAKVRDKGLPEEEFNALVAQKKLELQKLFAAYARADTDILMGQRMRSLQNQVVDIAPEQYQKLRQDFLNSLTVEMLNQDLRQQLSNDMALILLQPKGEPEFNMKALQAAWDQIMAPSTAAAATSVATDDVHPEVTDIPPAQ